MNTMIAEINTYTSTSKNLSMKSSALKALLSIWQRVNSRSESTADMEIAVSTSALQTLARGVIMRVCPGILVLGIALCVPGRNVSLAHEAQADDVLSVEKPWLTGTGTLATVTGQESPARMLHVPLAEAREDLHDSAKPERHIGSLTGEIPSGTLREEDAALKRRARLVGTRMRTLYGPEAAYQNAFIDAEEESGSRHIVAVMMPLTEVWEGAAFGHLSFFALKHGSHSAGRESLDLRFGMNPGRSFRPWFALTPYLNFGDAEGEGLGITAGMSQAWRKGADLSAEVFAWRPWDEGYYTIVEDGRKHGAALAITLPFTDRLTLNSRAYYEGLELGAGARSGEQYAGNRYAINARACYRLLRRDGAYMGYGFRDDRLWNEYLVGSELGIFLQVDFQRYFKPDGFDALNPVPEVFAQEVGLSLQYAFSPHFGLTAEGFLGRDPDRDLQFGELAGVNGRLIVVATPNLRIWAGASYMKTNTTLESSGGEETAISFGINYAF